MARFNWMIRIRKLPKVLLAGFHLGFVSYCVWWYLVRVHGKLYQPTDPIRSVRRSGYLFFIDRDRFSIRGWEMELGILTQKTIFVHRPPNGPNCRRALVSHRPLIPPTAFQYEQIWKKFAMNTLVGFLCYYITAAAISDSQLNLLVFSSSKNACSLETISDENILLLFFSLVKS